MVHEINIVTNVKYCRVTTCSHTLAITHTKIVEDYNDLIFNEGYLGGKLFQKEELVLNLDVAEEEISKIENRFLNKSMDSCFGVTNINSDQKEILLVEFKLRFTGFRNLRKEDLDGKVEGSILILGNSVPINKQYIFVFDSNLKQQATRRMFNMNPKIPLEYKAIDIVDLKRFVFD